ncbi:MAG: hypothetical protein K0R78_1145 [Pelosinus sp.]|nr:hypothetical protein [Pelosinus sp.]
MNNKKGVLAAIFFLLLFIHVPGYAQTIMYVPFDNRPVSYEYVTDTVKKGGFDILVPPEEFLAARTRSANPDQLWEWVFEHAKEADRVVVSADALIYGGLVASRTHDIEADVLLKRTENFKKLRKLNPSLKLYVFSTIMRSPHASSGGVEPAYYETYGPAIFRIHALRDKSEMQPLTHQEQEELKELGAQVPINVMVDWIKRRDKNYDVNVQLVQEVKDDVFNYLLIGRDDCSPLSRSHQESRWLEKETVDLPASKYLSFPGADQLGMVLLARAANDLTFKIPSVAVIYTQGVGDKTIPSYEDTPVGKNVRDHLIAAGCLPLLSARVADMVLAVNTPVDGWTREAGIESNKKEASIETLSLVKQMQSYLLADKKVAVADISFANGSDNALLHEMNKRKMVPQLVSYSGWNTASNTIGYTIGQAVFAQRMTTANKNKLVAVRLLDDWAYQANVRSALTTEVLLDHSNVQLDEMLPTLTKDATVRIHKFAQQSLNDFSIKKIEVSFPWNRMFEVDIKIQ